KDMKVAPSSGPNANFLSALNNHNPNIPQISIWGNENSPIHWRLVSSYDSDNTTDMTYVWVANGMRAAYNGFYVSNQQMATLYTYLGIFNPSFWWASAIYQHRALSWKQGRDWLDNSENLWVGLMNCERWETVTTTQPTHICFLQQFNPSFTFDCFDNCSFSDPSCFVQQTTTSSVLVRYGADGFFCEDRQTIEGLPASNVYEARGVNHNDEVDTSNGNTANGNDEMRRIFDLIWDRNDFFNTGKVGIDC
ncbi:MAG: hypothetical protein AAF206_31870, partial [Bacteroidota bacterium]